MLINERITQLRKELNLNQEAFGKRINVTRSAISNYEKGTRNIMDRVITDICREFNVNEEWLRNGTGEMFIEPDTFSLDEYAKSKGATDYELELIKGFFDIPKNIRHEFINYFKNTMMSNFQNNDLVATKKESFEEKKKKELESYALELEAESKGEISSALEKPKGA
ncbi:MULTISPECIES: helix-turn-helix domain-containing protein [Clostridium]|uniref:Transcriptional regulator n=1 Tax=Clostridium carnis TaxID=1530 RepID=A0ABY6SRH9_9CLOT|nr:helix-turn-helix transcriptional regulator [Clostridium carnis]CAI3543054.1 Transcriptional regulator [Clostridium neonatale]CAI3561635.1 Transcriptional regulator [Clostridium neonatale]CAI3562897.1 Transcriptional regulator [Clostridium neonatale]CAI3583878.1 Transcriptional regulator [Clostridium neonatale]CAI3623610.1 Transcriptional regulator [Clostridium neonatale]